MGFLKSLFVVLFPAVGFSVYSAFSLGRELPKASRRLGQSFGMGYNYFKVLLRLLTPETQQPGETMDVFRKANQQAAAFSRELKTNLIKSQLMYREVMPKEFTQNPLDQLGLKPDKPIEESGDASRGSEILQVIYAERTRIREKQEEKKTNQQFFDKI